MRLAALTGAAPAASDSTGRHSAVELQSLDARARIKLAITGLQPVALSLGYRALHQSFGRAPGIRTPDLPLPKRLRYPCASARYAGQARSSATYPGVYRMVSVARQLSAFGGSVP